MKNRNWLAAMCLALVLGLGACGQSGEAVNPSATESTSGGEETAPTVTDSVQAASEQETESRQEATEPEEVQIPEEYALAVIVTINPQVKLYLDADNVIVGVEYLNEDAKTAFSDIDFSDVTVEEGMEKIIHAAVEKEFLTDGKDVSIEVSEIRDESCDGEAVCAEAETAAVKAAEENHVTAVVTAKVSAEPTGKQTEGASGEITSEESPSVSEQPSVAEVPAESTPETTPVFIVMQAVTAISMRENVIFPTVWAPMYIPVPHAEAGQMRLPVQVATEAESVRYAAVAVQNKS